MPVDYENDTTLSDAIARLEGAEATEPAIAEEAFVQSDTEQQQTAALSEATGEKSNDPLATDTPATADKSKAEATEKIDETQKPSAKNGDKPEANGKSKFAKDAERLDKNWKSVQERTTKLNAQEESFKQREAVIAQREQKAAVLEAKARNKFTPEQYQTGAQNKLKQAESFAIQADGLERRAELLEGEGKYGEAEAAKAKAKEMREASIAERAGARSMEQMAEHLRKNPDPTLEQHKATLESHKRHYLLEAAKRWPEVAQANSGFQKTMEAHLQAAAAQGLDPVENPSIFYHVARLTAAEAAAARVPDMQKKLDAATAKVKELEALTAPGGGRGSVQGQPASRPLTDAEEEAELRQLASAR